MKPTLICLLFCLVLFGDLTAQATNLQKTVLSIERIWDRAAHNAFTGLVYFQDKWYCTFREGTGHIPGINGSIRVITSEDGQNWRSGALLSAPGIDLRDPKITVTSGGRLMLNIEAAYYEGKQVKKREPWVAFSDKLGETFSEGQKIHLPTEIATNDDWLWRVTWHQGIGYGGMYQAGKEEWDLRLLKTTDGLTYTHLTTFELKGKPNETTLRFGEDGRMMALVRREGQDRMGMIGTSMPPYQSWTWKSLEHRLGGPDFLELPDGSLICGTRVYSEQKHETGLAFMDTEGNYIPVLTFPSEGDTSYPGLVIRDGILYVSYYSSHEGRTAIYLARLSVDRLMILKNGND